MTTWTEIPLTDIDQDSPVTQPLMVAYRDNDRAMAEGSTGAPYLQTDWHPYTGSSVDDGFDGVIYDFDVDGAVAIVETPTFVDGFEYAFTVESVGHNSTFNALQFSTFIDTDAVWTTPVTVMSTAATGEMFTGGLFGVQRPFTPQWPHQALNHYGSFKDTGGDVTDARAFTVYQIDGGSPYTVAQTTSASRVSWSAGATFTSGKVFLMKRRIY